MTRQPHLLLVTFNKKPFILDSVKQKLSQYLKFKVAITIHNEPAKVQTRRNQKLATDFLPLLERLKKREKSNYVIGLIEDDLYVPELNFVFGAAIQLRKAAIISIHRLKTKNDQLFLKRILTEAIHELGHLFSLKHCHDPDCVMFFSNNLMDTDRKGFHFCSRCLKQIERKTNHKIR